MFSRKAFFVGLFGDITLQLIENQRPNFAGLRGYFRQHGRMESMAIASAIMYFLALVYEMLGLPKNIVYLFIYGGLWDIAFRKLKIMPSLRGYEKALSPLQTFIWGGISLVIPSLF